MSALQALAQQRTASPARAAGTTADPLGADGGAQAGSARGNVPLWQLAGHSARGASHVRAGLPNQDALALWPGAVQAGSVAVAAIADGHGGARHFRSDIGAALAVQEMQGELQELGARLERLSGSAALQAAEEALRSLPQQLVDAWRAAAAAHLSAHPVEASEWKALEEAEGPSARASVEADPLLAYGATVLGALAAPSALVLLQLGDGDALALLPDGEVLRPIPADPRLAGNFTTSLCRSDASADLRAAVLANDASAPLLLLLCTDGYANSFRTDADFLRLAPDFAKLIQAHGMEAVAAQLQAILQDASACGSGDDITLALIAARGAMPAGPPGQTRGTGAGPWGRGAAGTAMDDSGRPADPSGTGTKGDGFGSAASSTAAATAGEYEKLHVRLRRIRLACAALGIALCASLGWQLRDHLPAWLSTSPAPAESADKPASAPAGAPAAEPRLPISRRPGHGPAATEPGATAEPAMPLRGDQPSVRPEGVPAGAAAGASPAATPPSSLPAAVEAAAVADSASALRITAAHARARRTARGIEVTVDSAALPQLAGDCRLHASAWVPPSIDPAGEAELALPGGEAAQPEHRMLLIANPADKAAAKSLQRAGATFSVRVDCDRALMARSDRLQIS